MITKICRMQLSTAVALGAILLAIGSAAAEVKYQKPPQAVLDVFNAPQFPVAVPSPMGDRLLLVRPIFYPPIAELAKPMLRLAGLRIDPRRCRKKPVASGST